MNARPTDDAILLAMALAPYDELAADHVAHCLRRLGFDVSAQQAAAWLRRMGREEMAPVERLDRHGWSEYRLTRFGWTQLGNHWRGLRDIERSRRLSIRTEER